MDEVLKAFICKQADLLKIEELFEEFKDVLM
jgi:hypothetical protein